MAVLKSRTAIGLLAIVLAAMVIRLVYVHVVVGLGQPCSPAEYDIVGDRFQQHGTFVSPLIPDADVDTPSALMPPAYSALVAATYRLCGVRTTASNLILQLINCAAASIAVIFVFLAARRLAGAPIAWFSAVYAAGHPTQFGFVAMIWDTALFSLVVSVILWWAVRLGNRRPTARSYLFYGALLGACALLNPALTVTYPALLLWPLTRQVGWRFGPVARYTVLSIVGWAVVVSPWTVRNYRHFGELVYVRGGFMFEVWLGVCPEADTHGADVYDRRFPLFDAGEAKRITELGERKYIEERGRQGMQAIRQDPRRAAKLVLMRIADYWLGTGLTHSRPGAFPLPWTIQRTLVMILLAVETMIVLVLLFWHRDWGADVWWLATIVVVFSVVYCLTHIMIRFRAPIEPALFLLLAVLAKGWLAARKSHAPSNRAAD